MSQQDTTSFYRRIAGNTAYLFLGQAVGGLGLFVSYVIASRLLTRGDDTSAYDAYILAISIGVFFLSFSELGLTEGTTRLVASLLAHGRRACVPTVAQRALAILLVAGGAATAVVLVGAEHIARIVGSPEAAPLIRLSALWIIPLAVIRPGTLERLRLLARLPHVYHHVAALPDVSWKKENDTPTGTVLATSGVLVPQALGGEVSCGMRLMVADVDAACLDDKRMDAIAAGLSARVPAFSLNKSIIFSEEKITELFLRGAAAVVEHYGMDPPELDRIQDRGASFAEGEVTARDAFEFDLPDGLKTRDAQEEIVFPQAALDGAQNLRQVAAGARYEAHLGHPFASVRDRQKMGSDPIFISLLVTMG